MKLQQTLVALGTAALLAAPTAALADRDDHGNGHGDWNNANGQYQRHDRDDDNDNENGREHRDHGRHNGWNNPHNPHSSGRNNGYGRFGQNGNNLNGTVSSFSPFNLYLQNGVHVELHQGTVINPAGATPQPGERVQVIGHWNADRTFAADQINLY